MMRGSKVGLVLVLWLQAACGKNPRFCDESTPCGNSQYVCDLQGICPESEGLTNSCIPPNAICWDAGGGNQPDAGSNPDAILLDDGGTGYYVGGSALGVRAGVTLQVDFEGGTDQTTVDADGSFMFDHIFVDGDSYTVTMMGTPPCILASATGTIDSAPVTDVLLTCEGVTELSALTLSAPVPLAPTFSPTTLTYAMDTSIVVQATTVTATTWSSDATITVEGAAATSATPTNPIALSFGPTTLDIVVSHPSSLERTYQVTIDRGANAVAKQVYFKASNADPSDFFGNAVAASGQRIAIGAWVEASGVIGDPDDNSAPMAGAVYVFRRDGDGWVQEAYVKASNVAEYNSFGKAIALTDDTLAVGAASEESSANMINGNQNDNSAPGSGAVYVFRRTGNNWAQEAYIKASNCEAMDGFGSHVALDGDTLAVGAPYESSSSTLVGGNQSSNAADNSGAVYVFRRAGSVWSQEAYVKASNTEADDNFGNSVAVSGDTLAVGAPAEDSNAVGIGGPNNNMAPGSGAAYVYVRSGTVWSFQAYVKASNTDPGDVFGGSIALDGDRLAVGASGEQSWAVDVGGDESNNSLTGAGAVYVFRRSATVWTQEAYVKASNTGGSDSFGQAGEVALRGDLLLVGADDEDSNGTGPSNNSASAAGAAYLYRRSGTSWSPAGYFKASYPDASDSFGLAVAISDDLMLVGAPGEASNAREINGDEQNDSASGAGAGFGFH